MCVYVSSVMLLALCVVVTALSLHVKLSVTPILINSVSCFDYVVVVVVRRLICLPIRTDNLFSSCQLLLYSSQSFTLFTLS